MDVISHIQECLINNDIELAYQLIKDYENEFKDNSTFWILKANLCIKAELYQEAYNCLNTALDLEPSNPDIYYNMAYVCECMKFYSEAALLYGKAAKYTDDTQLKQEIESIYSSNKEFTYIKQIAAANKKRTYIILSSCMWADIFQRMHHIARALVKFDNRVLFVSPSKPAEVNIQDYSIEESLNYTVEHKQIVDGVEIFDPVRVKFDGKTLFNNYVKVVQYLLNEQLDDGEVTLIAYLPHHVKIISNLTGNFKVIYECVDDHSDSEYAYWGNKKDSVWEQELMDKADAVSTTATSLFLQRASIEDRANVYLSRNAVNEFDFLINDDDEEIPDDLKLIPEPRVVYTGAIYEWFDLDLFYNVVKSNPDKSFVIIGFGKENLFKEKCDNLYLLGAKKHQELKRYLKHMQAGIIPFKDNADIIINCDPIKQYEYLACELPVVTTFMPETAIDKVYTFLAGTAEAFSEALNNALKANIDQEVIRHFILKNSWNSRAALLCEISNHLETNDIKSRLESVISSINSTLDVYKHPNIEILNTIACKKYDNEMYLDHVRHVYQQSKTAFITRQLLTALFINNLQEEFIDVVKKSELTERYLLVEMLHREGKSKNENIITILELFCIKGYTQIKPLLTQISDNHDKKVFTAAFHFSVGDYQDAYDQLIGITDQYIESSPIASYLLAYLMKLAGEEEKHIKFKGIYETYEKKHLKDAKKLESFAFPNINISNDPFISIIVPTRNSADVVKYALKTCIEQDYNNYEIIVSDNSSPGNNDTKRVIEELNCKKIKYYRTPEEYAMIENYEFAYEKASGDYMMIIGSDDGLLMHALNTLSNVLKQLKNPLSLTWDVLAYGWPKVAINSIRNGLFIPYLTQKGNINASYYDESILKSVLDFQTRYSILPMFYYNSIIKRELAEEAKKVAGKVFLANPPDVYTGIVFSYLQKKYLHIKMPMTIGGSSEKSVGISVKNRYSKQKVDDENSFEVEKVRSLNQDYHSFYAPYFAGEDSAVVAASSVVKQAFGNIDAHFDVNRFNFYKKCSNYLYAEDSLEIKKNELYECIKSYGDPSIIKWYENDIMYNKNFKGYPNHQSLPLSPGYRQNGGLVIDASRFEVNDVFGAARLYRNIIGY